MAVRPPRGLSAAEAALWARLAATVKPLDPPRHGEGDQPQAGGEVPSAPPKPRGVDRPRVPLRPRPAAGGPPPPLGEDGLDSSWERKLGRAAIAPDFTLDLHGHTLEQAHRRLDAGLAQAKAMGARLVLLITGKSRPSEAADRGDRRGAIRAKVLDWLAAGPHAGDIAAIRKAHRRHGGDGALNVVLRRKR
jgi:DNA-nicking Smr family endonuclease